MEALVVPFAIIVIAALWAAPSAWFAKRRRRSMVMWGVIGMVFPLGSVVLLALIGQKKTADGY